MRVTVLKQCDTAEGRALFLGQSYTLTDAEAKRLAGLGLVEIHVSSLPTKPRARSRAKN